MRKPTLDEYKQACKDVSMFSDWIRSSNENIDRFLDRIVAERNAIKMYKDSLNNAKEIRDTYEAYLEVEKEENKSNKKLENKKS